MRRELGGLSLLLLAGAVFAGGYKIPEQSLRSTGTAGAYFSSANAPDASYYNPANMSFMKDGWGLEVGMRYIVLPSIKFNGSVDTQPNQNFSSEREDFLVPYFHYVSPKVGALRFGFSFTTPGGLSKSWEDNAAEAYAKTFHLEVYEASFAVSYAISDSLSVGGGLRGIYSRGEVEYSRPHPSLPVYIYQVHMEGDTNILPGGFLSVSYKPNKNITLSALYRTKVDLKLKGNAEGSFLDSSLSPYPFDTSGEVTVPLPAELRLGVSYKLIRTTFEFTYERTFWSAYEKLDFNFGDPKVETEKIGGTGDPLGTPKPKDWKDTNTYRLGIMHDFNEKLTGMLGIAYDETPVPERTLGFELPDSDGWIFSLGGIYRPEPKVEIGAAYLYFMKKDRSVTNDRIDGKFKDISAQMLTLSIAYSF